MSILVLDYGTSNITVACQRGGHAAPRRVGTKPISFAGGETSSVRAELMVVPVVLQYLTPSDIAAIRSLFALGAQVPCRGDVFNNASATIVCSGILADEFLPSGPWFEGSLTLYEIGTTLGAGPPAEPPVILTNDPIGGGTATGGTFGANKNGSSGLGWDSYRLFPTAVVPTCGVSPDPAVNCALVYTDPATPEIAWLTDATTSAGFLSGTPVVTIHSQGDTYDRWQSQESYAKFVIVRGGVDVQTYSTNYCANNGGFAGSTVTMSGTASILYPIQVGDRIRIELYSRLGLHGGYSDNSARQTITYGWLLGPFSWFQIGGLGALLPA